jgi:predicted PurR-regulated permease PerM
MELLGERIERSYIADGIIMSIGEENTQIKSTENWTNKSKNPLKRHPEALIQNITSVSNKSIKKIQETFITLSKETQNWVIISGIFLSIILLYLVITSVIRSQYTLFVPQKYRDMVAEARVNLDDATRMIDQPENF